MAKFAEMFSHLISYKDDCSEDLKYTWDTLCTILKDQGEDKSNNVIPYGVVLTSFIRDSFQPNVESYKTVFAVQLLTALQAQEQEHDNDTSSLEYMVEYLQSGSTIDLTVADFIIQYFYHALKQERCASWLVSHHKAVIGHILAELTQQRSIYIIETCSNYLVEFLIYLSEHDLITLADSVIESLWRCIDKDEDLGPCIDRQKAFSARNTKSTKLAVCCLEILARVSTRGHCLKVICSRNDRTNKLVAFLAADNISIVAASMIVFVIKSQLDISGMEVYSKAVKALQSLILHESTAVSAYRVSIHILSSLNTVDSHHRTLCSLVLSPLAALCLPVEAKAVNGVSEYHLSLTESISSFVKTDKRITTGLFSQLYSPGSNLPFQIQTELISSVVLVLKYIIGSDCNYQLVTLCQNCDVFKVILQYLVWLKDNQDDFSDGAKHDVIMHVVLAVESLRPVPQAIISLFSQIVVLYIPDLIHSDHTPEHSIDVSNKIAEWTIAHMCDPFWETRDTMITMIGRFVPLVRDSDVLSWITRHSLFTHLWHAVTDSEEYVRAAVLNTFASFLEIIPQNILAPPHTLDVLLNEVLRTLEDGETLCRRAAMSIINTLATNPDITVEFTAIYLALYQRITQDADWEVKLACIKICNSRIERTISNSEEFNLTALFPELSLNRSLHTFIVALSDCDPSVRKSAFDILLALYRRSLSKDRVDDSIPLTIASNPEHIIETVTKVCYTDPNSLTLVMFQNILLCVAHLYDTNTQPQSKADKLSAIIDDIIAIVTSPKHTPMCLSDQDDDVILDCY